MKRLHRSDLFGWSVFNEERNIDFNSVLWQRDKGNVLIDPLPLSIHDAQHLESLGGVKIIIVTNSDLCRSAQEIASKTSAKLYGPQQERQDFPIVCDAWLIDGEELVPGLIAYELDGSKTPGELALVLGGDTLITGDLIRCHQGGELCLLPDGKLTDKPAAIESVKRIVALSGLMAVLPGDGWPIFSQGSDALVRLVDSI